MRSEHLPFARPSINEQDIAAVTQVLRSGWITTGRRTVEFEQCFAESVGAAGAVAVSSATAGMHLVLTALGIGPGDEVITPSLTWVSTANLIVLSGATPVFADVDRNTLMVTEQSVRERMTTRTRAIVPVHFAGAALDLQPLRRLAAGRNIQLVEDAAHAMGTAYMGTPVGGTGTAIFSFHPIKNMTTGEGGMICSDDSVLLDRLRRLRFHGLGVDAYDRHTQGRRPQAEVIEPGFKYNLTDVSAALGLEQLKRVDAFNRRRRALAALYRERLAEIPAILPLADPVYPFVHSWHLFVVRLDIRNIGMDRDRFMAELARRNIGTGLHFRAVHRQKYYRQTMGASPGDLPETEWNSDRICSLPLFPDMIADDVEDVVAAIREVLSSSPRSAQPAGGPGSTGPGDRCLPVREMAAAEPPQHRETTR